ncbi:hypothetical protein D3C72_990310 [compost metagenome]
MARAVHDAQQAVGAVGAEHVEVAAHHVARLPQHEVVRAQRLRQLAVGQDGALDQAGVVDGVANFLVRGGHGAVGVFQRRGAFAHLGFQFGRVLADLVGHDAEGAAQVANFVLAARRQAHVVAAVRNGAGRLLKAVQGSQHQPLDGETKAQQHGGKQHHQADRGRPQPVGVQHARGAQVHHRQHVPVQLGHIRHRHQLARAVHADPRRLHRLRVGLRRVHGRAQFVLPRPRVQQVEHAPAIGGAATRAGVIGDQRGVHVRLDRAVFVHDDGRDAGLAAVDEFPQEAAHVQTRAGQPHDLVAVAHLDVDPHFGGLQLQVGVDVDVVFGRRFQRRVEPAVVSRVGAERVARRFGQRLVVVEVVVAGGGAGDEIGASEQIAPVAIRFSKEQFARGRIAFITQPAASDFAVGQAQGQGQFTGHRRQDALPVQLREVVGEGASEVVPDPIQHQPTDYRRGRQGDHARQQQRHQ